MRCKGRGMGAARTMGGTVAVAWSGDLDQLLAVVEGVDRLVPMPTGHDDRLGAQKVDVLSEVARVLAVAAADEHERLRDVRCHDRGASDDQVTQFADRGLVE